ncbi:MAG: hypothetical protein RLZZ519_3112 [Bacteroidota bacterium]|jgi:hypothetical protein
MNVGLPIRSFGFGKLLLLNLLLLVASGVSAQSEDPLVERFSLTLDDGRVLLNWVTRPGTTCDGVDVLRATDSVHFELIHHIPGICGGPNDAFSYSFLDEHPVANHTNYYRIGFDRLGESSIRSIEVVTLDATGFQVRPNPVTDVSRVFFANDGHENCTLSLIDPRGIVQAELQTSQDFFVLDGAPLQPQVYAFRIQNGEGKLLAKGRLLVQK